MPLVGVGGTSLGGWLCRGEQGSCGTEILRINQGHEGQRSARGRHRLRERGAVPWQNCVAPFVCLSLACWETGVVDGGLAYLGLGRRSRAERLDAGRLSSCRELDSSTTYPR